MDNMGEVQTFSGVKNYQLTRWFCSNFSRISKRGGSKNEAKLRIVYRENLKNPKKKSDKLPKNRQKRGSKSGNFAELHKVDGNSKMSSLGILTMFTNVLIKRSNGCCKWRRECRTLMRLWKISHQGRQQKNEFDETRTQISENATPLFGPRLLFGTLFWSITIAHNMAKQKIVIFFVNINVKAIIAMMMSQIK